jgi:ubiquinone/menaquinone biosynthesis C-methylase UbiE
MILPDSSILNNLYIPGHVLPDQDFEREYLHCRQQEQRIYSDAEVLQLPEISSLHPHAGEWQHRKQSCKRMLQYLRSKKKSLQILEIGCGNGWLCNRLSAIANVRVTGTDINFTELQQAARIFKSRQNLSFVYGDIRQDIIGKKRFDIILFAASIQYFSSLHTILATALTLLKPEGEIHIVDTHFYRLNEMDAARKRSALYYHDQGCTAMQQYYFHHTLEELSAYRYRLLNPITDQIRCRLQKKKLLYWICISKKNIPC